VAAEATAAVLQQQLQLLVSVVALVVVSQWWTLCEAGLAKR
jgi:hypothetical protein